MAGSAEGGAPDSAGGIGEAGGGGGGAGSTGAASLLGGSGGGAACAKTSDGDRPITKAETRYGKCFWTLMSYSDIRCRPI